MSRLERICPSALKYMAIDELRETIVRLAIQRNSQSKRSETSSDSSIDFERLHYIATILATQIHTQHWNDVLDAIASFILMLSEDVFSVNADRNAIHTAYDLLLE